MPKLLLNESNIFGNNKRISCMILSIFINLSHSLRNSSIQVLLFNSENLLILCLDFDFLALLYVSTVLLKSVPAKM